MTASDTAGQEYFGSSAALDQDLVVIGAPGEVSFDNSGEDSAYVFIKPAAGWNGNLTEDAILTASDGGYSDDFGRTVSASGDVIVVGAPLDNVAGQDKQGSAYVFSKPASGWVSITETDKLIAGDGTNSDEFGSIVSISGSTITVGASKDDVNVVGDNIGSAYIFGAQPAPSIFLYQPFVTQ